MPRFDWDGMEIGETRTFAWTHRSAAAASFAAYAKVRGLDWKCSTRSDPPSPKRGEHCRMVWVTRIRPRQEAAGVTIPERDNPAAPKRPEPFVPIEGKQRRKPLWIFDLKEVAPELRKEI